MLSLLTHVEAYRPESGFADALKGFILYEAKNRATKRSGRIEC